MRTKLQDDQVGVITLNDEEVLINYAKPIIGVRDLAEIKERKP